MLRGDLCSPVCPLPLRQSRCRADGFTPGTARVNKAQDGKAHINVRLAVAQVETNIQVGADATALDADHGAGTRNLNAGDIQQLPDDPNDFIQQLQIPCVE